MIVIVGVDVKMSGQWGGAPFFVYGVSETGRDDSIDGGAALDSPQL